MSTKGNAFLALVILALGVVFLWFYGNPAFMHNFVMVCGLVFIVPAVVSLLSVFLSRRSRQGNSILRAMEIVCGIGGLGLGACILIFPEIFKPLVVYLFAALMIIGGIYQLILISDRHRQAAFPGWMNVAPLVVLIGGVVLACVPQLHAEDNSALVVLMVGVAGVLFGLNGLWLSVETGRAHKKAAALAAASQKDEEKKPARIEEAQAEEKPAAQEKPEAEKTPAAEGDKE